MSVKFTLQQPEGLAFNASSSPPAQFGLGGYVVVENEPKDGIIKSKNAAYAEVGEWADGNVADENRIGYFVSIDPTTPGSTMVRAASTMDVRGVTVEAPAFSGNCSKDKFDKSGNLLKQYAFVAVMGLVSVIDNGTCTINGRCMPSDNGTAIPSSNNMGYQVVDRIDDSHVLIAVEPTADMIQRVKGDVTKLSNDKADKKDILFTSVDSGTLKVEGNVLKVNTTDDAEEDNTRPITSSGVHVIVGNINELLIKI